jgi:hypothetical protein
LFSFFVSNLNNPFSPQPSTPVLLCHQDTDPHSSAHHHAFLSGNGGPSSLQSGGNGGSVLSFNPGGNGGEDPRSRHSSAGSDCQQAATTPHSAPLSPYSTAGPPASQAVRVRHQSAGAATATIHYR